MRRDFPVGVDIVTETPYFSAMEESVLLISITMSRRFLISLETIREMSMSPACSIGTLALESARYNTEPKIRTSPIMSSLPISLTASLSISLKRSTYK